VVSRDPVLPGERGDVRERSVVLAMHLVRRLLIGYGDPAPAMSPIRSAG